MDKHFEETSVETLVLLECIDAISIVVQSSLAISLLDYVPKDHLLFTLLL